MSDLIQNNKFLLTFLFILAFMPRITSAILSNQILRGDETDYSQLAVRILEGREYHSDFPLGFTNARTPLYPLFIAVIYLLTNHSILAVKIAQAVLGAIICIIIFFIAENIFKDKRISFLTGLICAFYPLFISLDTSLMSETLFTFLLALAILFLLKCYDLPNLTNKFLSGLFLGLAALTKPIILSVVPFLSLWLILAPSRNIFVNLKKTILVMLFMILTIVPWIVRNYIVFKEFVPMATGGGATFYGYNNENTLAIIFDPRITSGSLPLSEAQKKEIWLLSEVKRDKYFYRLGWKFALSHPKDFLKIRFISLGLFWHLWPATPAQYKVYYMKDGADRNPLLDKLIDTYLLYFIKILYHLPYNILFLGMFISIISLFRKKLEFKKPLLLILLIAIMSLLYTLHGNDRYRSPIDPYVFLLGMHGIISFWEQKWKK